MCVSTAFAAEILPLLCASTAFAAKDAAFAVCVYTAFAAKDTAFPCDPQACEAVGWLCHGHPAAAAVRSKLGSSAVNAALQVLGLHGGRLPHSVGAGVTKDTRIPP